MSNHPNVAHMRHALEELGVKITCIEEGARHTRLWFMTPQGAHEPVNVKRGRVDQHKITGWARQHVNKANAKQATRKAGATRNP